MIPPEHDFVLLRREVSITHFLAVRGIRLRARRGKLIGPCPIHGGDNPTAFNVDLARRAWYCHTGCQRGGDVVDLVRLMDGCGYAQAAEELARIAHVAPPPPAQQERQVPAQRRAFVPFTCKLPLNPTVPFLRAKGIHPATAGAFEAGGWNGRGFLSGCVGVRLHDPLGNPLGYAGRHLDESRARRFGKWRFPRGIPKRELLYNYHRVHDVAASGLVIVEGAWEVMRLAQLGVAAAALLGAHLTESQASLLRKCRRLLVLMDGDRAGRRAARAVHDALASDVQVTVRDLPSGVDPDDLTDRQLSRWASFPSRPPP